MKSQPCGAVCADDPNRKYPCVEPALHSTPHKDSRGWTWGQSNDELATSARAPEDRARAAARAEYWRGVASILSQDDEDDEDGDE